MEQIIQLAIYIGKLEARLEAAERRISELESQPTGNSFHVNMSHSSSDSLCDDSENNEESCSDRAEKEPGKLFAEGINNIMGYQWPPRKEGE